jgi:hypothetical protein
LKTNLFNIKKYILDITDKGKEKIRNELDIKDNGYFISNNELESNNNSYYQALEKAKNLVNEFDNDESNDKAFIDTMIKFKENYTNICKYMDKIKKEKYPLFDDALNTSLFTSTVKKSLNLDNFGVSISNSIRNENDKYLNDVNKIVNSFLNENKKELNDLFLNLTLLFSEESLLFLDKYFKNDLDKSLNKIKTDIETNKKLSQKYFDGVKKVTEYNNDYILELLKNFHTDEEHMPYILERYPDNPETHYRYLEKFVDSISSKGITQGYLSKYQYYKNNIQDSKDYITNSLFKDIKNEYKDKITKFRESFQKLKNCKISDVYPNLPELDFIDKNINQMNEFYDRLNKYISDEQFNNYYLPIINEFKNNQSNEITNIDSNVIEYYHNIIKSKSSKTTINEYQNDYCLYFFRKKTYYGTFRHIKKYNETDYYCFPLNADSNNHEKLIKTSTNSKPNFSEFLDKFNKLYSDLNKVINSYNSKIEELKKNLNELKTNALKDNTVNETLENLSNKIKEILNNYYGENLIKGAHDHFKQITNTQITDILEDLENKWNDLFSSLKTEVENNKDNYKNSIKEFGVMAMLIQQIFIKNITNSF